MSEDKQMSAREQLRELDCKINMLEKDRAEVKKEGSKPEPQENRSTENVVVVDGLPKVPEGKVSKLVRLVQKVFGKCGTILPDGCHLPCEGGKTTGCAFIEYAHPRMAQEAVEKVNNYSLDKKHTLRVNPFAVFAALDKVAEEYEAAPAPEIKNGSNLHGWLLDRKFRDQYVVRYGELTEVYWNDPQRKPQHFDQRRHWTEAYCLWSPHGSFLATIHEQGVMLWGGEKGDSSAGAPAAAASSSASSSASSGSSSQEFTKPLNTVMRFQHPGVKLIDFSPCERYLVTFSPQFQERDNPKHPRCVVVWDVRTGVRLRGFVGVPKMMWPHFSWSPDGSYLVARNQHGLAVYEAPSMQLLNKRSFAIENLRDYCWSPSQNYIVYWVPSEGSVPTRVTILSVPWFKEVRSKTLYNVVDCKLNWHPQGDFLCVKVERHTKSKKSTFTNFELFRMRDKNIPIEVLEYKDQIYAFAWEPRGTRFAICHGQQTRPDTTFHDMGINKVVKLSSLEKTNTNHLFWSPAGRTILLAGMRSMDGHLIFYDAQTGTTMAEDDHFGLSNVCWDPSGRFVSTFVSAAFGQRMENGYSLYSFQGKLLQKILKDQFFQFLWRPRPPTLLTRPQEEEIQKNLPKITKQFQREEREQRVALLKELEANREAIRKQFRDWQQHHRELFQQAQAQRAQLWGDAYISDEEGWEEVSYIEEVVENEQTQVIEAQA
jgi:translation initiation factor 3 subunit B